MSRALAKCVTRSRSMPFIYQSYVSRIIYFSNCHKLQQHLIYSWYAKANLSAEKKTRTKARIPKPHEYSRRPQSTQAPQFHRSTKADGLNALKVNRLPAPRSHMAPVAGTRVGNQLFQYQRRKEKWHPASFFYRFGRK